MLVSDPPRVEKADTSQLRIPVEAKPMRVILARGANCAAESDRSTIYRLAVPRHVRADAARCRISHVSGRNCGSPSHGIESRGLSERWICRDPAASGRVRAFPHGEFRGKNGRSPVGKAWVVGRKPSSHAVSRLSGTTPSGQFLKQLQRWGCFVVGSSFEHGAVHSYRLAGDDPRRRPTAPRSCAPSCSRPATALACLTSRVRRRARGTALMPQVSGRPGAFFMVRKGGGMKQRGRRR